MKAKPCGICGSAELRTLLVKDDYPVVRCEACALVQVGVELSESQLEDLYGEDYFSGSVFHEYLAERDARLASGASAARTLARLANGRLLDVGAAAGFFLEAASEHFDVTGVELSPFASAYARKELGLRVLTGDLADVDLAGETFDVVTLWNTIEHMADPRGSLARLSSLTRPGSLLVLSTGDVDGPLARRNLAGWNLMSPPYHLYFFSPRTIDLLLTRTGFELRRIVYDGLVAESGPLVSRYAQVGATVLGLGNVMTVYAVRARHPPAPSRARRLAARYRPLARVPASG